MTIHWWQWRDPRQFLVTTIIGIKYITTVIAAGVCTVWKASGAVVPSSPSSSSSVKSSESSLSLPLALSRSTADGHGYIFVHIRLFRFILMRLPAFGPFPLCLPHRSPLLFVWHCPKTTARLSPLRRPDQHWRNRKTRWTNSDCLGRHCRWLANGCHCRHLRFCSH